MAPRRPAPLAMLYEQCCATRLISRDQASPAQLHSLASGEADVEDEVPEPQVEHSAASPVDDECQQDDGQNDDHHPEEKHDDGGDGIPRYSSRSSHDRPATRDRATYSPPKPPDSGRFSEPLNCACRGRVSGKRRLNVLAISDGSGTPSSTLPPEISAAPACSARGQPRARQSRRRGDARPRSCFKAWNVVRLDRGRLAGQLRRVRLDRAQRVPPSYLQGRYAYDRPQ